MRPDRGPLASLDAIAAGLAAAPAPAGGMLQLSGEVVPNSGGEQVIVHFTFGPTRWSLQVHRSALPGMAEGIHDLERKTRSASSIVVP